MSSSRQSALRDILLRLTLRVVLRLASLAVPMDRRVDWLSEWNAELWQLENLPHARKVCPSFRTWSLARGVMADALWLRIDAFRSSADAGEHSNSAQVGNSSRRGAIRRGSASWCLQMLTIACLICGIAELLLAGSWHALQRAISEHFFDCFIFVVLPGIFVAVTSSPLRPRKCDRQKSRLTGLLSANTRWNLFLAAKLLLTMTWGFLISAVITSGAHRLIGHWADWVELLSTALAVILSLRWALLDQERRCQHCLRMLSQPTRVGFASRNFLDWNGTELICADGHGLLHVTEMQGSWCWYDLWVELDPTWQSLFSAQRVL